MNVEHFIDCTLSPLCPRIYPFTWTYRSVCNTIRMIHLCCILPDPQPYKFNLNHTFADPAIMSASTLVPPQPQPTHNASFTNPPASVGSLSSPVTSPFGPPGLVYPPGIIPAPLVGGRQVQGGPPSGLDVSQASGSVHGESNYSFYQGRQSQVRVPSGVLSVPKLYHRP